MEKELAFWRVQLQGLPALQARNRPDIGHRPDIGPESLGVVLVGSTKSRGAHRFPSPSETSLRRRASGALGQRSCMVKHVAVRHELRSISLCSQGWPIGLEAWRVPRVRS